MQLEQRRILITGGGSGIGLALAHALAPTNDVVVAGRDAQKLERAKASLPALHALQLDVTSESAARAAVAWMTNHLGGIDLLVNSAGVLRGQAFEAAADSAMGEEVAVNLLGSARMTRVALPFLRQSDDGAVVFLSSAVVLGASPGVAVYAATKAAVHSLPAPCGPNCGVRSRSSTSSHHGSTPNSPAGSGGLGCRQRAWRTRSCAPSAVTNSRYTSGRSRRSA